MNYGHLWKAGKDLAKQDRWAEELRRWENAHPEHQPFKEDNDSQRQP